MTVEGLKVAIVGAGKHALGTMYPAMIAAGYDIRAVATRHRHSAELAASRFGGARAFDSVEKMLESVDKEIEALVLVLPPEDYEATLAKCIPLGKPIYCEKPAALDTATLCRIDTTRVKYGATIMVGYMKRFAPAYQRARCLVTTEAFGRATAFHAYWGMGPGFPSLEYLLRENATHHLDLARYLMGEAIQVHAYAYEGVAESFAIGVLLQFESGAVGTLQMNNNSAWDHDNEWISVTGLGHVVTVDNVDTCTHRVPGEGERRWRPNYTVPNPANSSLLVTGFTGALRHFVEVVRTGEPCQSDLSSATRTMKLAELVLAAVSKTRRSQ